MNNSRSSQQKAAIYDRWLFSLGGGEQVAFAYAEALRDFGYKVDILTHKKIDQQKAEEKMNIDLKSIEIRYIPEMSTPEVSQFTPEYDIFINTSYLDYFPNHSKLGILSVFFPDQIFLSPFNFLKRGFVVPVLRNLFIYPTQFEGFIFDEFKNKKLYRWLGQTSKIVFSQPVHSVSIELSFETFAFSLLESIHFSDGKKVIQPTSKVLKHTQNKVSWNFTSDEKLTLIEIHLPENEYSNKISLSQLTIHTWRYALYNKFKNYFPRWEMRLHGGPGITKRVDLQSYQKIITISDFCQRWIKRYWKLESEVLYPPVNTSSFQPSPNKKNHVLHIGRFFVTGHSKKQLDLIKSFKALQEIQPNDWELHLVGSVETGRSHQEYFDQCVSEAAGFPIHFHTDIPFTKLKKILSEASIYWHATGLDEDEEKRPILMEHFGITTVEAMASGCVPVVINKGGQPEIVTQGSGFVWDTREELIKNTLELINNEKLMQEMSLGAVERSRYFSREEFKKRFKKILDAVERTS